MPFPRAKVIKGSPQLLSVELLLMSCWFRRPLRLPTLQAVTIALHCPSDCMDLRLQGQRVPHQRDFTPQSSYRLPAVSPRKPDFLPQWPLEIIHKPLQSTDILSYSWVWARDTHGITSSDVWLLSWRLSFGSPPPLISWLCVEAI